MQTRLLPALLLLLSVQVRRSRLREGELRAPGLRPRGGWAPGSCPLPLRTGSRQGVAGGRAAVAGPPLTPVSPQYGLYAGEFLRGKPARERAQNGPDACAPPALLLGPSGLSPEEGRGTGAPSLLHPPNCCCGDLPPPEPAPLGLGLGRALSRGGSPLPACGHGGQPWEGRGLRPRPSLGRTRALQGQGLTLKFWATHLSPTLRLPLQVGGYPHPE